MRAALVPVNGKHVKHVARHMRAADVAEVWALDRSTPRQALERSVASAVRCWTGMVGHEPACIVGVSPASLLGGEGVPWLLATDRLLRAGRPLVRLSRPVLDVMHEFFPVLSNVVDARNATAIAWLRALGFTLSPAVPYGVDRLPFHPFRSVRHV